MTERRKDPQPGTAGEEGLVEQARRSGLVPPEVLRRTLEAQQRIRELGYEFGLGELLVRGGHLSMDRWAEFTRSGPGVAAPPDTGARGAPTGQDEEALLRCLHDSPRALTTGELASALGWGQRRAASTANLLAESAMVHTARVGRARLHWHPERPFYPEWGLVASVPVAREEVTREHIVEQAERQVRSTLFIFDAEEVASCERTHLPLWGVTLHGSFPEGLIFKKTRKRTGTLYFHGARGQLCTLDPTRGFGFGAFSGEAPDVVRDLDDVVTWEEKHPAELQLNPRLMDHLKQRDQVRDSLQRKHGMTVEHCELRFLPCWKIFLQEGSGDAASQRLLVLDGVLGLPVHL